ncbi:unnamed protein product [Choristocarpus tenellus]
MCYTSCFFSCYFALNILLFIVCVFVFDFFVCKQRRHRSEWVKIANQESASVRCLLFTTPKEVCFHLNAFRACNPWGGERRRVPDVVIHTWFKNVEPVDASQEGFKSVVEIPFVAKGFKTEDERELFFMHLLPK